MKKAITWVNENKKNQIKIEIINPNADTSYFHNGGVGVFIEKTILYRGLSDYELYDIWINNKPITGGEYSAEAEQKYGASFAYNIEDAVKAVGVHRKAFYYNGTRLPEGYIGYKGKTFKSRNQYVIEVDAKNYQFMHPSLYKYIPRQKGTATIDGNIGNIGLGFAVSGLKYYDIKNIWKVDKANKLKKISERDIAEDLIKSVTNFHILEGEKVLTNEQFILLSQKTKGRYLSEFSVRMYSELPEFQLKQMPEKVAQKKLKDFIWSNLSEEEIGSGKINFSEIVQNYMDNDTRAWYLSLKWDWERPLTKEETLHLLKYGNQYLSDDSVTALKEKI